VLDDFSALVFIISPKIDANAVKLSRSYFDKAQYERLNLTALGLAGPFNPQHLWHPR
jgi:hypothetical protein